MDFDHIVIQPAAEEHVNGEEAEDLPDFAGSFNLAVAAPSMKAPLEAWGADSSLFHQGGAKQSEDADAIAATMAAPGRRSKAPRRLQRALQSARRAADQSRRRHYFEGRQRVGEASAAEPPRACQGSDGRPEGHRRVREGAEAPRARQEGGPLVGGSASGARRLSTRLNAPWTRPVGSTKRSLWAFKLGSR